MTDTPKGVGVPTLTVTGGPQDGVSLLFKEAPATKFLGSGQDCHLRIELSNIAPRHARVTLDGRGLSVEDIGSQTGTYINGERLTAERMLGQGDRLCLGPPGSRASVKLLVRLPEAGVSVDKAAPPPPPPEPMIVLDLPSTPPRPAPPVSAPPPPPSEPPPPPPAAEAPAPPPPAPAPPPPRPVPPAGGTEARRPRPEYTDELPSIAAPDTSREPSLPLPALKAPTRVTRDRKPSRPSIPPAAFIGGAALLAVVGAYVLYTMLAKNPPTITSVTPPRVQEGQALNITGTNFVPDASGNVVHFGDLTAKVTQATETQIIVSVPVVLPSTTSASFKVNVESHGRRSNTTSVTVYAAPRVSAIEPDVALPGDTVVLKGVHLDGKPLAVLVGGVAAELSESEGALLRFKMPEVSVPVGRDVTVVVQAGGESSPATKITVGHLPLIRSINPSQVGAGERITIAGKGFGPNPEDNEVTLDGQPATMISGSPTEIVVVAPGLGLESQVSAALVVRSKAGQTTGRDTVHVTRPSLGSYVPRFFPLVPKEHPAHDHVFVANELGPVFLLTGKADSPSTAARGERVAAALNVLVASARGTLPPLEIRSAPTLALAQQGSPAPIVTITPEDAAGYDEGWGGPAGHKSTPQQIANFWLALLQDELTLFLVHQRPNRLLEVTTRGKVLTDLYAEGARRGGPDAGVPMAVLTPLSPSTIKAFRDLALNPGEGQGSAASALEGTWEGTWEETGTGTKEVAVRFELRGGKLAASLTTRAGGVAMDVPLTEVSYEKGVIHFLFMTGGTPSRFTGTLASNVISGTVEGSGGKETGKFSLQFRR